MSCCGRNTKRVRRCSLIGPLRRSPSMTGTRAECGKRPCLWPRWAQRWIVAALRHRKFFSLEDLNVAIRELLGKLNHRPFRKKDGTRASVWEAIDKPALKPLPMEPFDMSEWYRARVNIDYHVAFDANFYSVPYNLVHEVVEVRSTPTTVEILHKGARVASHLRRRDRGKPITQDEHRPKSHREHLEWTPSRMVHWAASI